MERAGPERQFFRVSYPDVACPTFEVDGVVYLVTDLSESGIGLRLPEGGTLELGAQPSGVLYIRPIDVHKKVSGTVVRVGEGRAALRLRRPWLLPIQLITSEQRRLIASGYRP
ncbi:MAG: PilZ domain-containing protein [Myxococcota bacterium]